MNLPSVMYAIKYSTLDPKGVLEWAEHPMPLLQPDDVLIQIATAGINRADIMQRQGRYPAPEGDSPVLGLEVAGIIVAIGDKVSQWTVGDKVCALVAGGGYAEYVAVAAGQCLRKPDTLSWVEAAALPEGLLTVWANIFEDGHLQPQDTVLVHGGSSGIGTLAIRMVKLWGARIIVTAGTDHKCKVCKDWGADFTINYKTDNISEHVAHATDAQGVNIILDMVGGDTLNRNLALLAPGGRHLSIAAQQGRMATLDLRRIMTNRLVVTGSTLRSRSREEKARLVKEVAHNIWPWVISGALKPFIYKSLPIKNAGDAHKLMEFGEHIGKIVLEVQPTL